MSDLSDLEATVDLRTEFRARRFAKRQGDGLMLTCAIGRQKLSQLTLLGERRTPLLLGVPQSGEQTIRYVLPVGYRPLALPADTSLQTV